MRQNQAIRVAIQKTPSGWALTRNGRPFVLNGIGGTKNLELFAASGGTSVRTWGAENAGGLLDRCHGLGLTVTLGIWLGHKEHGFRYDDPKAVAAQYDAICGFVARYKDHPALLCWALGNEMEVGLTPTENELLWRHVESAVQYIHKTDPNHPVMSVVAEVGDDKIGPIQKFCPSLDILGINAYGGILSLADRIKKQDLRRPYVVTEFGPSGPWEAPKTAWGAPIELSSTAKKEVYAERYAKAIKAQRGRCLGSYVFLWDDKVEGSPTWFGMFTPQTGEKLAPVDALIEAWSGRAPQFRCPEIASVVCSASGKTISPGQKLTATVVARDPSGCPLRVRWELRRENNAWLTDLPGAIGQELRLDAPSEPGPYRLFVYVRNNKNGAATANIPFQVK